MKFSFLEYRRIWGNICRVYLGDDGGEYIATPGRLDKKRGVQRLPIFSDSGVPVAAPADAPPAG